MVNMVGQKKNTYTLWVDKTNGDPVRYEMMGYDSLIGSHYDKYYLDYEGYKADISFSDAVFSVSSKFLLQFLILIKFLEMKVIMLN